MSTEAYVLILACLLFLIGFMLAIWSAHRQLGLDAWRRAIEDETERQAERIESTVGKWRSSQYNRDGTRKDPADPRKEFDLNDPDGRAAARAAIKARARNAH